jgi:hypothetical protein
MITQTERALLVGVFDERRRAQDALRTLDELGFARHQLGYAMRCGELMQATGALDGVDAPEHDLAGGLIALGAPVAEARALRMELERGRAVVTVQPHRLVQAAERVLALAGATSVFTWAPRWLA